MRYRALPPGPKPRYPGEHLVAFRRDKIGFLRRLARDWGDVTTFWLTGKPLILVNHPDIIRDILVTDARCFAKGKGLVRAKRLLGEGLLTSEGDFHRQQRRLMQPAFHRKRIEAYGTIMAEHAAGLAEGWRDGETRDLAADMTRLTLGIVGKTLFDADVGPEADEIGGAISEAIRLFNVLMLPGAELLEKLPLPMVRRFREARGRLDATIYRLIAEHRASGDDRGDLMSMLLMAQDEERAGMTDEQVRDEAMTIFLAGHETTANAMVWTWYLLAQNPECERRFHDEVDAVLGGRLPTAEDLPRLPFTRQVLAESLRLYPPAWIIGRRALAPYCIGPWVVPQDAIVLLCESVTHVDARFFPDPERFDPSRWTPEAEATRPKFAYYPFGGGPRTCIGEQFAWMEGVLLLATLGQHWRFDLVPDQKIALEPILTLRPKNGMRMVVRRRDG